MKQDKQDMLAECLKGRRYRANPTTGTLYYLHKESGEYRTKIPAVLPSGYKRHVLYNGKRGAQGIKVIVYEHLIMWFVSKRPWPTDKGVIRHIDGNKGNSRINNLVIKLRVSEKLVGREPDHGKKNVKVSQADIELIKIYHKRGLSPSEIAQRTGLKRTTVLYHMNKDTD